MAKSAGDGVRTETEELCRLRIKLGECVEDVACQKV